MDRINGADTVDIGGGRRGFRDEDLLTGQIGTEVTAAWLNMVQEEMIKVIESAGLVLNPADWTQLSQALKILGLNAGLKSRRWQAVMSATLSSAPGAPNEGDAYLVPTGATGVWASHAGKIAEWVGSAWSYTVTPDGHGISLPDGRLFVRRSGAYSELAATAGFRGLVRLASLAAAKAGIETDTAVTPAGLAGAMPVHADTAQFNTVHATVLTADNRVQLTAGAGQIELAAFKFLWRDSKTISVPAQTFPTSPSKVYHLRVAYDHVADNATVSLFDLASAAYNPTSANQLDPMFDATFDNVLLARVSTSAGNVATIVPLKAAATLSGSAKNTTYTESSVGVAQGWISSPSIATNFNRTPKVTLSSFNFDSGPNVEMANRIEVRASRESFQVDCFGYGIVISGSPTSASYTGYRFITGVWEASALA